MRAATAAGVASATDPPGERSAARGYALAALAATLWALNGNMARYLLDGEEPVSAARLSQLRSIGSWVILLVVLAAFRRDLLRVDRKAIPALALLGTAGLALVHASYFVAIDRLKIGVALTIQYLAPLLVLVWLRVVHGRRLATGLWGAVMLSSVGCLFVVGAYRPGTLDGIGLAAAFASAIAFAVYVVGSERAGRSHEPVTTLLWAFGFASLLWAVLAPWWAFPFGAFASVRSALLGLGVVVIGTLVPFVCMVAAVRHVPAARAAVVATLEPVLAALFAFLIHDEALAVAQLAGAAAVLGGVAWVQSHRPDLIAEAAPEGR